MNNLIPASNPLIALVGFDPALTSTFEGFNFQNRQFVHFANGMQLVSEWLLNELPIVAIISQSEILGSLGIPLVEAVKKRGLPNVPFLLVVNHLNSNLRSLAIRAGIVDVFKLPFDPSHVEKRVTFLIDNWAMLADGLPPDKAPVKSVGMAKRIFDIVFAGAALLLLSPLLLVVYLLIKLESKGPAFYYALRVGSGYRVFKFFKFRSMYVNADQRLKDLKHLNQYAIDAKVEAAEPAAGDGLCDACRANKKCQSPLYADNMHWCEQDFRVSKRSAANSAFFKIKNDPRITRVGNFIRNTSIDELPQLWNVIIGDMSIVGNRPLPLYEAEKLTTDKYALRFSAPAGITGLWQVEKRGKGEMSEDERLMLDNKYASTFSLKNDLKLILKTIPALLQKESV